MSILASRGTNWQGVPSTSDFTAFANTTRKGFTGQEMLDAVSLIHLNGRVYDPFLGRFLSADSVIQTLGSSQAINPYAYAWNAPLRYIDPSGHSLLGDILSILVVALILWWNPLGEFLLTDMEYYVATGAIAGFAGGFVGALASTGSLAAALTAGFLGAITGAAFGAIGTWAQTPGAEWTASENVLAHAAVGCGSAVLSGGNCGKGAAAAALSEAAEQSGLIKPEQVGTWGSVKGAVESGIVGGAAAAVSGGKFQEGFSTGAAGYLLNCAQHASPQHGSSLLLVQRLYSTDDGTVSRWTLISDGEVIATGFGIEPEGLDGEFHDRVAPGVYSVDVEYSKAFKGTMLTVEGAIADGSGREMSGVLIHPGNFPRSTEGCYVPGGDYLSNVETVGFDSRGIANSAATVGLIRSYLASSVNSFITYVNPPPGAYVPGNYASFAH